MNYLNQWYNLYLRLDSMKRTVEEIHSLRPIFAWIITFEMNSNSNKKYKKL